MDQGTITFHIQDMELGWTCVSFAKPPRVAKSRTHALIQFLESWRQNHPTRRIEKIEFVEDSQMVRGINIFWSVFEHLRTESMIDEFTVDEDVEKMYGLEYAEALMQDALAASANNAIGVDKSLMVSKRLIAIVILRPERMAFLTSFHKLISTMDEDFAAKIAKDFERWKTQETNDYFCTTLPAEFKWKM